MFLVGILKRLIGQNSNYSVLSINRHSFADSTEKFPAYLDKLNDIAPKCVPKSTGQSTGSYKPWFNSECENADNSENYNVPFTIRELCDALKKSHDTATGPDEIHYQLLKHLPRDSLMVLGAMVAEW